MLDAAGRPVLADAPEPDGPGELVRVRAVGLCGSDVEKLGEPGREGAVLGHEVVGGDRRRPPCRADPPPRLRAVRAVPRGPRVDVRRVPAGDDRAGRLRRTRVRATAGWTCPTAWTTRARLRSSRSRACSAPCRACRAGVCSSSAQGFVGRLFAEVLAAARRRRVRAGRTARANGARARRPGRRCGAARPEAASTRRSSTSSRAGRSLLFADAGRDPGGAGLPPRADGRRVALGDAGDDARGRSASPGARAAGADGPPARALPRGPRAAPQRTRAQGRLHAVRAARFHAPGDVRIEDVPRPEPDAAGDVLLRVEVALTDGTDLKAFRRGHPVLLRRSAEPVRPRALRRGRGRAPRSSRPTATPTATPGAPLELSTARTRSTCSSRSASRA